MPFTPQRKRAFDALFNPSSVAIVGASAAPHKQGNTAIKYLVAGGFSGAIYPINPSGGAIEGIRTYASILDAPGEVECALFVIPAAATIPAIEQCARKGVRAIIVGSNGFAELGTDEGRARQNELTRIARENDMVILGPNTNGVWNVGGKFSLGYNTSHGDPMTPGPVSIAAHSGALFNSIAPALRAFGACLNKFVPVGNEADADMLDFIEYFIDDDDTRVIGLIMEGVRDGARLRNLAKRARAVGKPVVALKLGRSEAGAGAALAHSSRLAGSARAYASLLRGCGILSAPSIESLAGACALLANGVPSRKDGDFDLISVSTSGGGAELVADHAADRGIRLAGNPDGSWDRSAAELIKTFTGAGLVRNPVDGGNLAGWPRLEELFGAIERDGRMGPVLLYSHMLPRERSDRDVADMLIRRRERTGSPVFVVAPGGVRPSMAEYFSGHRVPVFHDIGTCFDSLRCYYDAIEFNGNEAPPSRLSPAQVAAVRDHLAKTAGQSLLTEIDSAAILRAVGAPMVESIVVRSRDEACAALVQTGGSVVLKGIAPGIAHKNDAGLVATALATETDVDRAYTGILKALAGASATFIVQKMISARVELIAGVTFEPPLGHFIVVGLGGVLAEILDEAMLFPIPSAAATIAAGIENSRLGALLRKIEAGASPGFSPIAAVVDVLQAIQALALEFPDAIRSVDINPLIIGKDHVTAVDALIELRSPDQRPN